MSSDNSSNNTNNNTNGPSPIISASRPKLTLNFSKNLPEAVAKKLEASKLQEKVTEAKIRLKSQIQVQDQTQQKE